MQQCQKSRHHGKQPLYFAGQNGRTKVCGTGFAPQPTEKHKKIESRRKTTIHVAVLWHTAVAGTAVEPHQQKHTHKMVATIL